MVGILLTILLSQFKKFKEQWFERLNGKSIVLAVPESAKPMLKETEKHATSLAAVTVLNKKVHVQRYNMIISDLAPTMCAIPTMHIPQPTSPKAKPSMHIHQSTFSNAP